MPVMGHIVVGAKNKHIILHLHIVVHKNKYSFRLYHCYKRLVPAQLSLLSQVKSNLMFIYIDMLSYIKLDAVGPVDNRPSTD